MDFHKEIENGKDYNENGRLESSMAVYADVYILE